jgi:hypothetical protein
MPMVTDTECQFHPKLSPMIGETMPKILHLPTAALPCLGDLTLSRLWQAQFDHPLFEPAGGGAGLTKS